jgi:hypothetical protein
MTVREHLIKFLDWHLTNKKLFKTHHIQDLSQRGLSKFGKRLGSPETYTRLFRDLRQDGYYEVDKLTSSGSNEKSWYVKRRSETL